MKNIIRTEEAALFLFSLYLYTNLNYPWWLFLVVLFLPDISMVGYLWNNRVGAMVYNIVHFRGSAILIYIAGVFFSIPLVSLVGLILFAHSTMDRMFGFGLKTWKGFKFTHLGEL